jgi:hypothetical protein
VKFFYLRDEHRNPVACVASKLADSVPASVHDRPETYVLYAVSTWNPTDAFKKDVAKSVAAGRLEWGQHRMLRLTPRIKRQIVAEIAHGKDYPKRAREAAGVWLREHQLDPGEGGYGI